VILSLVAALVYIGILIIVGYAAIAIFEWATDKPVPRPISIIVKAIIGIICLLVLLQVFTGGPGLNWPYLTHRP
jgi:hypothetical protein